MGDKKKHPLWRILQILKFEKKEIYAIYFYAIMLGLVQLTLPLGIQAIISFVLGGAISTSLVLLIILVVLGVFLNGLMQVSQMKIIEKIQQQLMVRYAFSYTHKLPKINLKSVRQYFLPELTNRFFDVISLQKGVSKLLLDVPTATIQILFGMLLLAFYHPAFIFFGIMLISVLYLILRFTGNRGMETSLEESTHKYKVAALLEDIARMTTLFRFTNVKYRLKKSDSNITNYLEARTSHFKILLVQYWALIGFKLLITAAMLIVGAFLLVDQQLNIGQFIAAEIVIILVINSVEKLIVNLDKVYDVITSLEKINQVLDKPTEEEGNKQYENTGKGISMEVNGVGFSYDGKHTVLKDLNLKIEPGDKLFVYGKPASGKTTFVQVLCGLYNDAQGQILVNEIPIHKYDKYSLRKHVGIVLQTPDIYTGTLLENISLGNEYSYHEVFEVAEVTDLKDYIQSREESLDMQLQPNGVGLPASIARKLVIARVLLAKPELVFFDDAFTGMEENTIKKILAYIEVNMSDSTIVVTSSNTNCSTICDKVFVLENGTGTAYSNRDILNDRP